ncbi:MULTISPECIES: antitoxin [unclassified Brachybacterium]|uniref:antitoxin n=1 Tax=unclassified Brachybacterium TaxID=2623841 RepID=UPI000C805A4F|nr:MULTISPECIES: antitoxin [unclassified Brachybacterium]PMC76210.1 antitoxin [Brachybacterium sp. UMB0905]
MSTLYIRDVPADVTVTLKERAAARGQSLSAYLVQELTLTARRPTNEQIVARLRDRPTESGATHEQIIAARDEGRR